LKTDLSGLNDDKIYYELDKIEKNKISIENHFFKQTFGRKPDSFDFVNYDLSTTYFVGYKCSLSDFEKLKDIEYDLSEDKEYSFCKCYRAKGCDIDENGDLYCVECQKTISGGEYQIRNKK
jgi:hypothetical protein